MNFERRKHDGTVSNTEDSPRETGDVSKQSDLLGEDGRSVDANQDLPPDCAGFEPSREALSEHESQHVNSAISSKGHSYINDLSLHRAVFNNDTDSIYGILENKSITKDIINHKDKHGNTALHLACMLGRSKEIVSALLQCGASIDCKNLNRWTPFHEACSYGDREIIRLMALRLEDDLYGALNKHKLAEKLGKTKNYRLILKWEFQSCVPFLTRWLPSDSCVITKFGRNIRLDTNLLNLELSRDSLWRRRPCSLIYSDKYEKRWIVMNHNLQQYQCFNAKRFDRDIEEKVDAVMSNDIMDFELRSNEIQLTRSTSGWIWKADKIERIGKYTAAIYTFNNVYLVTKKRREHMSEQDMKRNKQVYKSAVHMLKFGRKPTLNESEETSNQGYDGEDENNDSAVDVNSEEHIHRESLPPPPATRVTWSQYISSEPGKFPTLGRDIKCKVVETPVKAGIAMTDDFPITKNEFIDLLTILPLKHFKKLKETVELKLPEGFPIRIDAPIFHPFLSARVTVEDFTLLEDGIDESLFTIPDYWENRNSPEWMFNFSPSIREPVMPSHQM